MMMSGTMMMIMKTMVGSSLVMVSLQRETLALTFIVNHSAGIQNWDRC